ncbi:hypothetical protein [Alloactinosynnema sp. L-07]|nr:hypothetical protein [Alloactinosynnema sp. L-07]CRK59363.1 hypothetical protein [Alloactinosynnema sp. L-07]
MTNALSVAEALVSAGGDDWVVALLGAVAAVTFGLMVRDIVRDLRDRR